MKAGVIGAGQIGANMARLLAAQGYTVTIANSRGPDSIRALADKANATPGTPEEAVEDADLVVVSVPMPKVMALKPGLLNAARPDAVVIDTCNYYPGTRDDEIAEIEDGMVESVWVSRQIGRPTIKTVNMLNEITLATLGKPAGTPGRIAIPVAGDDGPAKRKVMDLIDAFGFDPVDTGPLSESWRHQPGSPVYGMVDTKEKVAEALAQAVKEDIPAARMAQKEWVAAYVAAKQAKGNNPFSWEDSTP